MTNTSHIMKASLFDMIKAYSENKDNIHLYLRKQAGQTVENYSDKKVNKKILGVSAGVFVLILLLSMGLFIWAIVALVKFGGMMPGWALGLSVVLMIFFPFVGSIITIILAYVVRKPGARANFGFKFY